MRYYYSQASNIGHTWHIMIRFLNLSKRLPQMKRELKRIWWIKKRIRIPIARIKATHRTWELRGNRWTDLPKAHLASNRDRPTWRKDPIPIDVPLVLGKRSKALLSGGSSNIMMPLAPRLILRKVSMNHDTYGLLTYHNYDNHFMFFSYIQYSPYLVFLTNILYLPNFERFQYILHMPY